MWFVKLVAANDNDSMSASNFTSDPFGFASRYAILVNEMGVGALKPAVGAGNHAVLDGANYTPVLHFTVGVMPGNSRAIVIHQNAQAGSKPLYFLPYEADAATSMVLGNEADYFFTSSLSGCTVRVLGPSATPTVTHANARTSYGNTYNAQRAALATANPGMHVNQVAQQADALANVQATNAINAMIPAAPGGGVAAQTLTKTGYLADVTTANFLAAKLVYKQAYKNQAGGFKLDQLEMERSLGKPTLGSTVFGLRNFNGVGWTFHYQTTVGIEGTTKKSRFIRSDLQGNMPHDEVVLCPAQQLFP